MFIGVRAVDTAGNHSPVAFPVPGSSTAVESRPAPRERAGLTGRGGALVGRGGAPNARQGTLDVTWFLDHAADQDEPGRIALGPDQGPVTKPEPGPRTGEAI